MITDKDFKMAENEEEAFWTDLKDKLEKDILNFNRQIEVNEFILKLVEKKIKEIK